MHKYLIEEITNRLVDPTTYTFYEDVVVFFNGTWQHTIRLGIVSRSVCIDAYSKTKTTLDKFTLDEQDELVRILLEKLQAEGCLR